MILTFMCAAGACRFCEPDKHRCEHGCHDAHDQAAADQDEMQEALLEYDDGVPLRRTR